MLFHYHKDALFVFLVLALLFSYFTLLPGWNENSRFDLIFAVVEKKTLSIDDYYNQGGIQTGDHSFVNGHYYSDKPIGPAILGALIYKPMYWFHVKTRHFNERMEPMLTFFVIGLPSAIAGSLMYILCFYLSHKRLRSFLITLRLPWEHCFFLSV